MVKFVVGDSSNELLYHTVFWIGSAMQIICTIMLFFFKEEKYDYGFTEKEEIAIDEPSINISDSITAAVTPDHDSNSD